MIFKRSRHIKTSTTINYVVATDTTNHILKTGKYEVTDLKPGKIAFTDNNQRTIVKSP